VRKRLKDMSTQAKTGTEKISDQNSITFLNRNKPRKKAGHFIPITMATIKTKQKQNNKWW